MTVDRNEESERWQRWRDDPSDDNRNSLIDFYIPLLRSMANRYHGTLPAVQQSQISREELVAEAVLELPLIFPLFDESRGYRFSTYAHRRLLGVMQNYLRSGDHLTRKHRKQLGDDAPERRELDFRRWADEGDFVQQADRLMYCEELLEQIDDKRRRFCVRWYSAGKTFDELGKALNVTRSRANQLYGEAIQQLQKLQKGI